jgi:hypothetical protein
VNRERDEQFLSRSQQAARYSRNVKTIERSEQKGAPGNNILAFMVAVVGGFDRVAASN